MIIRYALLALVTSGMLAVSIGEEIKDPAEEVKKQKKLLLEVMGVLPGDLIVEEGKEYFHKKGPNGKSCASCHGKDGKGEKMPLVGVYATMPKYYKDIDKVADIDLRIKSCMEKYLGYDPKKISGKAGRKVIVPLATYVASLSNGMKFNVKLDHPKEKEMFEKGKELWYARVGKMDFSCAMCHDKYGGYRIRLQTLAKPKESKVMRYWPAYRYSKDKMWTMEDRIRGCYKQIRVTRPPFYHWAHVALQMYMAVNSNGGVVEVPGFVR